MRFSYAMLADYPLSDSLSSIRKADELGVYAVYEADEIWHKDLWLLFAAAAVQTSQIRMGQCAHCDAAPGREPPASAELLQQGSSSWHPARLRYVEVSQDAQDPYVVVHVNCFRQDQGCRSDAYAGSPRLMCGQSAAEKPN